MADNDDDTRRPPSQFPLQVSPSRFPSQHPSQAPSPRPSSEFPSQGPSQRPASEFPSQGPSQRPASEFPSQRPSQRPSQWPSVVTASLPEMTIGNLKLAIPVLMPDELFTTLVQGQGVRVERIVSRGHCSPPGFWYDQDESEFVLVIQGRARMEVVDQGELDLRPGDYLVLPPHQKHRVTWTDPAQDTVWLAVHYQAVGPELE